MSKRQFNQQQKLAIICHAQEVGFRETAKLAVFTTRMCTIGSVHLKISVNKPYFFGFLLHQYNAAGF